MENSNSGKPEGERGSENNKENYKTYGKGSLPFQYLTHWEAKTPLGAEQRTVQIQDKLSGTL